MITFGAKYLTTAKIGKVADKNNVVPYEVALTEFNPASMKDKLSIGLVAAFSLRGKKFAKRMSDDFFLTEEKISSKKSGVHYIGLIRKQNKYSYVRPKNILGLVEVCPNPHSPKTINVNYLQALKWPIFNKYCYIGTGLLNYIKKAYPGAEIELQAVPSSVKFYRDNGFKQDTKENGLYKMTYTPQIKQ